MGVEPWKAKASAATPEQSVEVPLHVYFSVRTNAVDNLADELTTQRRRFLARATSVRADEMKAPFLTALHALNFATDTSVRLMAATLNRQNTLANKIDQIQKVATPLANASLAAFNDVTSSEADRRQDFLRGYQRWQELSLEIAVADTVGAMLWAMFDNLNEVFRSKIINGDGVGARTLLMAGLELAVTRLPFATILEVLLKLREVFQGEIEALKRADESINAARLYTDVVIQWCVAVEQLVTYCEDGLCSSYEQAHSKVLHDFTSAGA